MNDTSFPFSILTFDLLPTMAIIASVCAVALWIAWVIKIGSIRGTLAIVCRLGWIAPLFLAFFPETMTKQLPRSMALRPLHILLDDSDSMKVDVDGGAPIKRAESLLKEIEATCAANGCIPRVTRLSEQDDEVEKGYSTLSRVLEPWLYKVGQESWVLISDGGDWRPENAWDPKLKDTGRQSLDLQKPRAMIVGFEATDRRNIWIDDYNVSPFSFENKPLQLSVNLARATPDEGEERIQVQVLSGDRPLATVNAEFTKDATMAGLEIMVPPLPKGRHLLTVRALPTATESTLWDNAIYTEVEVMPNTVGVLHLLGAPSWDGRFLRRYLKAEPKYDLISFFILRDPWDSQQVGERELSLIPFPVERLFREELPNFRVVIIQNFTLFQFLLPEYQNNLVKFIKNGGGVLFLGGPRALQSADLRSSPLKEILPFDVGAGGAENVQTSVFGALRGRQKNKPDPFGPAHDPDTRFKVELAKPEDHKRALANVYDDWESLGDVLTSWDNAKGLHHMERVKFKEKNTTPLLYARTESGEKVPLAVASYPGKGRALWVFSDSMWRLAMNGSSDTPRNSYNRFMHAAMTWLMRQDLRKPLIAKNLVLSHRQGSGTDWTVTIKGPASKYFRASSDWNLLVCGTKVVHSNVLVTKSGSDELILSGQIPSQLAGGQRCQFRLDGKHAAFGSVSTQVSGIYPRIYGDTEVGSSPQKLSQLATLTGAELTLPPDDPSKAVRDWLETSSDNLGIALPNRFKTHREFFWMLEKNWYWLLVLLMPLEVLIRRWDHFSARTV